MGFYPLVSILLVGVGPAVAGALWPLRVFVYHTFFIFFFHAIGALFLYLSYRVPAQYDDWGWGLVYLAMNFYAGACFFLIFSGRDLRRSASWVVADFLRRDPAERIALTKRRWVWPVVLFPALPGCRAAAFTGRRWRGDIKAAVGWAEAHLTNRRIVVQLLFPRVPIIEIRLRDVRRVGLAADAPELLELDYGDARVGAVAKLAAFSGAPLALPGRIQLNLGRDAAVWLERLRHDPAAASAATRAVAPRDAVGTPRGAIPDAGDPSPGAAGAAATPAGSP